MNDKSEWTFKRYTSSIGETGDYDTYVLFTNGKNTLQSSCDEIDDEELQQFCDLLNLMPDLYSHKEDALEVENTYLNEKIILYDAALNSISLTLNKLVERYENKE